MLFNLIRGSGIRGLTGIPPKNDISIRPILPIWRHEIREFLHKQNIPWREDSSNADMRFSRNKIRQELIPIIKRNFGDRSIENIFRTSQVLRHTAQMVKEYSSNLYKEAFIGSGDDIICLELNTCLSNPFIFGEILRNALLQLNTGLKRFSNSVVKRLYDNLFYSSGNKRFPVYNGIFTEKYSNVIMIVKNKPIQPDEFILPLDKAIKFANGLGTIRAEIADSPQNPVSKEKLKVHLAYKGETISIRPFISSYNFHPLGGFPVRIEKFLKNRKIPAILMKAIPIVFFDEEIAWVGGVEISEKFKLDVDTENVVKLSWEGDFAKIFEKF